jgi:hypothetical protein
VSTGEGELRILFLLFLGDRFAQIAGILTAQGHLHRLRKGDHFGVFPHHVHPRHTLQDGPLSAAGKAEGDEDHKKGETSHGGLIR